MAGVRARFEAAPPTPLLSAGVAQALASSVDTLRGAGAQLRTGGTAPAAAGYRYCNTLLRASGDEFLAAPERLQTEVFGNAALFVVARDGAQLAEVVRHLEGSLTGSFYSDTRGSTTATTTRSTRCSARGPAASSTTRCPPGSRSAR